MSTQALVEDIIAGDYDADFDSIREAIRTRSDILNRTKVIGLRVGDRVRFNTNANPKYLIGLEGVVQKKNQTTVVVKIEGNAGRFTGTAPRCPISIVDKVSA